MRNHILPTLGAKPLGSIKPGVVQAWLRGMDGRLAPTYIRVLLATLSAILTAAVDDERIPRNPCSAGSVRAPRVEPRRVQPWPTDLVNELTEAMPQRYRLMVTLGAGLGLRQGEIFGLAADDIDTVAGVVLVWRQVKIVGSRLVYGLPKGRKTRTVPLPRHVARSIAAHRLRYGVERVELPWNQPDGESRQALLLLTSREQRPLNRNYINSKIWKPALESIGIEPTRHTGMHQLRHWYASTELEAGTSIKAVSEYLGHTDAGFTLRTYTHLMPSSEERARDAIDAALGGLRGPLTVSVTDA